MKDALVLTDDSIQYEVFDSLAAHTDIVCVQPVQKTATEKLTVSSG